MTSSHAPYPPSAAERWLECPGSVPYCAERGLGSGDSVYSREGTFAHDIAARSLNQNVDPGFFIGFTDGEFTCDEETAGHIRVFVSYVRSRPWLKRWVEHRVELIPGKIYGTADAITLYREGPDVVLEIVDYKHGAGKYVDEHDNKQLLTYLEAARRSLPDIKPTRFRITIIQPRCYGAPVRTAEGSLRQLDAHRERCEHAIADTTTFKAGSWCRWCPARLECDVARDAAFRVAADVFAEAPQSYRAREPRGIGALTGEQIRDILDGAPVFEEWIASLREYVAKLLVTSPGAIPEYELRERRGRRAWITDVTPLLDLWGLPTHKEPKKVGPSDIEKAVGRKAFLSDWSAYVRAPALDPELIRKPLADAPAFTEDPFDGDVFPEL